MPVHTVKFTGDTAFTGTHTSGNKIYCRSTDATSDDGTINLYGRATSGSAADYVQLNPGTNEGKIEQLSSANWSHLYLADRFFPTMERRQVERSASLRNRVTVTLCKLA